MPDEPSCVVGQEIDVRDLGVGAAAEPKSYALAVPLLAVPHRGQRGEPERVDDPESDGDRDLTLDGDAAQPTELARERGDLPRRGLLDRGLGRAGRAGRAWSRPW